ARKRNVDGVICGHIHHAEKKLIEGIRYYNCGDWVESCTALVEDEQGEIQILYWTEAGAGLQDNVIAVDFQRRSHPVG
ncbi:MAG: hypothetical protein LBE21_02850, partial [Pseudomonadales bacterium]|nr:hypothetical protein [Pseudomonadales bacterium]